MKANAFPSGGALWRMSLLLGCDAVSGRAPHRRRGCDTRSTAMKVKFSSEGAPANELELERLRRKMGAEPPSDYLDFLKARNGCRVETNVFRVNETNDAGVNASLDVDAVIDEKAALGARLSRHTLRLLMCSMLRSICLSSWRTTRTAQVHSARTLKALPQGGRPSTPLSSTSTRKRLNGLGERDHRAPELVGAAGLCLSPLGASRMNTVRSRQACRRLLRVDQRGVFAQRLLRPSLGRRAVAARVLDLGLPEQGHRARDGRVVS